MFTPLCVLLSAVGASWSALSSTDQFLSIRRQKVWCSLVDGWSPGWGTRRRSSKSHAMKQMAGKWKPGMDIADFQRDNSPDFEQGPSKKGAYNPNFGYEPYWAGGDWVLKPMSNLTAKMEVNDYCNNKCSPSYVEYGAVCARNKTGGYQSFANYCQMKGGDCDDRYGWTLAYRGNCSTIEWGKPGGMSVFNTKAKVQPGIKKEIIERFYKQYGKGIGSDRKITKVWGYSHHFEDF